eukprot:Skav230855  [mRNA]  locus=scaffold3471:391071:399139:- [translate_table: standard]
MELTGCFEQSHSTREPRASEPQRPSQPPRAGASRGSTSPVTVQQQQMLQVRASAGGGGQMLSASRQRSPQGSQAPSHFRSPVATPSMAYPCSLQVPGSGLNGAPPHGVQVRQVPQAHAHPHMAPGREAEDMSGGSRTAEEIPTLGCVLGCFLRHVVSYRV